jgi:hypothetical protein
VLERSIIKTLCLKTLLLSLLSLRVTVLSVHELRNTACTWHYTSHHSEYSLEDVLRMLSRGHR